VLQSNHLAGFTVDEVGLLEGFGVLSVFFLLKRKKKKY
jgi:hypothetical protein